MRVVPEGVKRGRRALRASDKAVCTWALAIAVDAGPMQIQLWEGAVLRCAETGRQRATHYTMCQKSGYQENV